MSKRLRLFTVLLVVIAMSMSMAGFTEKEMKSETQKKVTIRWLVNGGKEIKDGNVVQKELEKKFNVKIVNVAEDIFNSEKINLLYSSGNAPDCGFNYSDPNLLYKQAVTRSIPKSLIRKYAPSHATMYDKNPTGWLINRAPDKKDEFVALTGINESNGSDGFYAFYRLDWLEKLGISPKGPLVKCDDRLFFCKTPFTLDELKKIFDGFTNKDPDGNGKKDTWAMTGMDYCNYTWGSLFNSFQLPLYPVGENLMKEDGKYKLSYTTNRWKAFLKYANDLYKKGYVDPEWTTLDWSKSVEKMTSGLVGWYTMAGSYSIPGMQDRPPYGVLAKNPKAKVLVTPPEAGPDGKTHFTTWNAITKMNYTFPVGAKVNDEKLKRILMMFNYINYDKSVKIRYFYGEENKLWKWEGIPYKSAIIVDTDTATPDAKGAYGARIYIHPIYDAEFWNYMITRTYRPIYEWTVTDGAKIKYIPQERSDIFNETKLADVNKKYASELNTIITQFYMKAIVGEVDIDNGWDDYIKRLNNAGMDKVLAELSKAPLVSGLMKGKIVYK